MRRFLKPAALSCASSFLLAPGLTARLSSSSSPSSSSPQPSGKGVLIGNPKNGVIDPVHVDWTDIAGVDTVLPARISAGKILALMDMCAARAAQKIAEEASRLTNHRYLTCTVGVTNTVFSVPILNGDAIRLDARVVHCGDSSLGVYIRVFRQSPTTRTETPAGESFYTMVTITPDLKAAKVVPAMEITDPLDVAMHKRYLAIREIVKINQNNTAEREKRTLHVGEVDCPINMDKALRVPISSTLCRANRIFFSAFLNNNNTVFGGELMSWMEQHAVHCGRMFTGNRHIFTIGMHSVSFPEPVFATDWVTLEATVIYVRNTTMEVDVILKAERRGSGVVITNRASFVLINNNDIGQKAFIPYGLDLKVATQSELQRFMAAKVRYLHSVERKNTFMKHMGNRTPVGIMSVHPH